MRRRQAEEFKEIVADMQKSEEHRRLIEKRRAEAKRERELGLLRLRHRHEAAELKRSISDKFSDGKPNVMFKGMLADTFPN